MSRSRWLTTPCSVLTDRGGQAHFEGVASVRGLFLFSGVGLMVMERTSEA